MIPYTDHYLKDKYKNAEQANLALSRGSILFLAAGMVIVGLSPDILSVFGGKSITIIKFSITT